MAIITELNIKDVITLVRQTLELPTNADIDEPFLACVIRRLAAIMCPCSPKTLISETKNALNYLTTDCSDEMLTDQLESTINRLLVGADLIELADVTTNDINVKGTWLFAAQPSFVVRSNGKIFILGVVQDENLPLSSLANRIKYDGCKRVIEAEHNENLVASLLDFGFTQLSEMFWLKSPKVFKPEEFIASFDKSLSLSSSTSQIPGLTVIDPAITYRSYKKRWKAISNQSGRFVARRPQLYGSDQWCYVELARGELVRFVDMPVKLHGVNQRACDSAWQLQMAIDRVNGQPQDYSIRQSNSEVAFDFFSPLPQWAERRLSVIGKATPTTNCLFSYSLPIQDVPIEQNFLRDHLWINSNS